ncbi:MAG: hypothetical protein WD100_07105 [Tistlia sp.]|uniref:hypothetical protein n=1 Tax=Tistlia sp. TaxID=3057121 RepID=UPI0034A4A557
MTTLYTLDQVRRRIADEPDLPAGDIFEPGSFARELYDKASNAHLAPAARARVDREEASRWALSDEQWATQLEAVALAREHDAKLKMLKEGVGRV